jgi:hypothetical protein
MSRRFQFNLGWLMMAMTVVAICFGAWAWLPDAAKLLVVLSCPPFIVEGIARFAEWWRTGSHVDPGRNRGAL